MTTLLPRLLAAVAVVAVVVVGIVLPASPSAACSCVSADAARQAADAPVAFSGVVVGSFTLDDLHVHRLRVSEVYAGEVRRRQDVVERRHDTCGDVGLEEGAAVLVLGHRDEDGRVAVNGCAPARLEGTDEHASATGALGAGSEPQDGSDFVAPSRRPYLRVVRITVLAAMVGVLGFFLVRRLRARRG